ncbi:hypothetical protein, partial [Paraburkholderia humisilvae]|uniref:hypothetical protein n=1 Tax=Paraburkholderia humisilvae TaxID=627669 RepID=UPI0035ECD7A0
SEKFMSLQKHCASYATTMVTTLLYNGMDLRLLRRALKRDSSSRDIQDETTLIVDCGLWIVGPC